jgi:hypothetical protein
MLKSGNLTKFFPPLSRKEYSTFHDVQLLEMQVAVMKRKHEEAIKLAEIEAESIKRLRSILGGTEAVIPKAVKVPVIPKAVKVPVLFKQPVHV